MKIKSSRKGKKIEEKREAEHIENMKPMKKYNDVIRQPDSSSSPFVLSRHWSSGDQTMWGLTLVKYNTKYPSWRHGAALAIRNAASGQMTYNTTLKLTQPPQSVNNITKYIFI